LATAKNLKNWIHGWFPQEPCLISSTLKLTQEKKQPPPFIPSEYKVSATKYVSALAIFWITFYGLLFTYSISSTAPFMLNIISGFQVAAWIIAGAAVGTISCALFTRNLLKRLARNYQTSVNEKDMTLFIITIVLFSVFGYLVSWFSNPSVYLIPNLRGLLISVFALGVSIVVTQAVLFAAFERKENMRIMQRWFGPGFVLIPKPPKEQLKK
jgi:MFS family permease